MRMNKSIVSGSAIAVAVAALLVGGATPAAARAGAISRARPRRRKPPRARKSTAATPMGVRRGNDRLRALEEKSVITDPLSSSPRKDHRQRKEIR